MNVLRLSWITLDSSTTKRNLHNSSTERPGALLYACIIDHRGDLGGAHGLL